MRKLLCALVLAATLLACAPRPNFHVTVDPPLGTGAESYKLIVNGREAGPFAPDQPFEFDTPATRKSAEHTTDMVPEIRASVLYVCGWQEAKVLVMAVPGMDQIEAAKGAPVPARAEVAFDPPLGKSVLLYVDNNGGPDATISVGALKQRVPAGTARQLTFPLSTQCEEAKLVRLNGEVVQQVADPQNNHYYLLDTSGARCYKLQTTIYGNFPAMMSAPKPELLRPQKMRALSDTVEYFMSDAPSMIMANSGEGEGSGRTSLNQTPCK